MANYNPYVPQILGQEWVPIRDENLVLDPFANTLERGYGFTLSASTQVSNARFYVNTFPPLFVRNQGYTANIYPRGAEAESGPVQKVIIPCNYASATGGYTVFPSSSTPIAEVVYNPSANEYIRYDIGNSVETLSQYFFATNSYAQLLNGKRILGVNFLTNIDVVTAATADPNEWATTFTGWLVPWLSNDFNISFGSSSAGFVQYQPLVTFQTPALTRTAIRVRMGDSDMAFGGTNTGNAPGNSISQWTYTELQRFERSASNRIFIALTSTPFADAGAQVQVSYMALEVFYCEEKRVAFGTSNIMGLRNGNIVRPPFQLGMNQIALRNLSAQTNPILPAGQYTVTLSLANSGDDFNVAYSPFETAKLNELRQLYEIPTVPGVQVNLPFPLNDEAIGTTLTKESTALIPQLSLHTSGGAVITDCHPYGRQAKGQVWGNNFVTQDIDDSVIPSLTSWPYVRYYARRFCDTTTPLVLSSASPTASGAAMRVQITPAEFDALDEINDGWKEVTLRFPTAPQMGASQFPTWRWTATGETAGNGWEVLGAAAYAASGIAQQMTPNLQFGQVPAAQQLYSATYGAPSAGSTINEEWLPQLGPYVSGATQDQAADAVLIFSQDMPTVTGLAVAVTSQALTGIGLACGIEPCGIPSALLYNRVTWGFPVNTGYGTDAFERTVSNGLGSADVGGAYVLSQAATNYNVTAPAIPIGPAAKGNAAIMNSPPAGLGNLTIGTISNIGPDFDITITTFANGGITGSSARGSAIGRYTDANNYYEGLVQTTTTTGISIVGISRTVGGAGTVISTVNIPQNINNGNRVKVRFMGQGRFLKIKAWSEYLPEPDAWNIELTDTNLTTGSGAGFAVRTLDTRDTVGIDDFTVTPPRYWFGYYELQRSDSVTDWQTIMKATSPQITGFNDYEARTNTTSSYRIRGVNNYAFTGPWSSTVTVFLTSPGVSGSCFDDDEHVLMFTSNERQNGSINLAYSEAWEGHVSEDFNFAEASFTQLQPMFERDFFTAFRPTERGGDQFSRNLLINAAAISPPTLPGFRSLSDMAWANVSYICVRDEDGNRWFATVNVPTGTVQNRRRLYMATINIAEVTETPSPVDP